MGRTEPELSPREASTTLDMYISAEYVRRMLSYVLVERRGHVAAVYVMIVNCWTSHGRRSILRKISTD